MSNIRGREDLGRVHRPPGIGRWKERGGEGRVSPRKRHRAPPETRAPDPPARDGAKAKGRRHLADFAECLQDIR